MDMDVDTCFHNRLVHSFGQRAVTVLECACGCTLWFEPITPNQKFFNEDKVRVENHAQNGRSTRTFITEKRWQAIIDKLKKGDYVFIQFGHNDQSKEKVDRYTPPEDYRRNLMKFITEVRERHGIPVLLTPVMRRRFDDKGNFFSSTSRRR